MKYNKHSQGFLTVHIMLLTQLQIHRLIFFNHCLLSLVEATRYAKSNPPRCTCSEETFLCLSLISFAARLSVPAESCRMCVAMYTLPLPPPDCHPMQLMFPAPIPLSTSFSLSLYSVLHLWSLKNSVMYGPMPSS